MTNEIDFLNQDAPSEQSLTDDSAPQTPETESQFIAPNWEDVKAGKINYKELPGNMKAKIKQEAFEETPEDKKWLWEEGFTPPELYSGFDKHGRKVDAYDLDGFEELLRRKGIAKKAKIEQDVENLTHLVKEQNKNIISQQEREIDKRLSEAQENVDFETYKTLLEEKQDLKFQKLQLNNTPKEESKKANVDYALPPLEDQATIEVFRQNNKTFVDLMALSPEMIKYFDEQAAFLGKRNPNAPMEQVLNAVKTITENHFNLNKQQRPPMTRNNIQSEQRTNLNSKPTQKLTYSALGDRDKKWINGEARSGKPKYAGKSLDEITNMVYGHLLKK